MSQDDILASLMADIKCLQLKVGALEATIADSPELRQRYEALLRAAKMQLVEEQKTECHDKCHPAIYGGSSVLLSSMPEFSRNQKQFGISGVKICWRERMA
jgi:hypothetical protein